MDGVAGPPADGWDGAVERTERDGHLSRSGRETGRRHLLLPALWAVQSRVGWISAGALNYVCQRLQVAPADAYGVATFYSLLSVEPRAPIVAHVCDDLACRLRGGRELCARLETRLGPAGRPRARDAGATWLPSPCLGQCDRAPAVLIQRSGEGARDETIAPAALEEVLAATGDAPAARRRRAPAAASGSREGPRPPARRGSAAAPQTLGEEAAGLRLLRRVGRIDPTSLDDYRAHGGYGALRRAFEIGPEGVLREILESRLMGRGGAAFPTGRKWEAVARAPVRPHYLVCNADESEPGTFKDRVLLEEDPFAIVEAMTIAAYATGCETGYVYIRGEYPLAIERVTAALAAARTRGLLGERVLGEPVRFDVEVRRGAGAYICGEETALFNSIEGFRGEPRNKPPFPVQAGLFHKPTVINNVETLANVPDIVLHGGPAFAAQGAGQSTGPKLFCLSGAVARPGVYEVAFGATLRRMIEMAGGVRDGRRLRAILLGGAAGSFVDEGMLDVPLTFEATRQRGAALGSGVVMVFDETADLTDAARRIAAFFRDESCGQCVPCRVGTERQEELLTRLAAGRPLGSPEQERALLDQIAQAMRDASICGLGQTASGAVQSALALLGAAGSDGPAGRER